MAAWCRARRKGISSFHVKRGDRIELSRRRRIPRASRNGAVGQRGHDNEPSPWSVAKFRRRRATELAEACRRLQSAKNRRSAQDSGAIPKSAISRHCADDLGLPRQRLGRVWTLYALAISSGKL